MLGFQDGSVELTGDALSVGWVEEIAKRRFVGFFESQQRQRPLQFAENGVVLLASFC